MLSFCYVDRQKSSVGSSEKSQVVHSANWKEQVRLKKELELLQRQENKTIERILTDQRMVTNKFLHHILRSIDEMKAIEKMKDELKQTKCQTDGFDRKINDAENNGKVSESMISDMSRLGLETERPKPKKSYREVSRLPRPVTASELQGRAWERKIILWNKNIQRARSASNLKERKVTIQTLNH